MKFIEQKFNKSNTLKDETTFEEKAIKINAYAQKVTRFEADGKTVRFYFTVPDSSEVKQFKGL